MARAGLDPRERELACDPGAAEKLTAEVFGHGRANDLAHWRGDGGAAVAIERGGELAAFAYRRGERIGPAAGRDEPGLLQAVAAAAAAGAGGGGSATMRVPGACASLLEALVSCGFRIGDPTLFMASRPFGRPELYLLGAHSLLGAALISSTCILRAGVGFVGSVMFGLGVANAQPALTGT
jgi:hypothetical protein